MDYIQAVIYTTSEGIEPVTDRLCAVGAEGVEIEDQKEFNEFLEQNRRCWDYVDEALIEKMSGETKVKIYIPDNSAGADTLAAVKDAIARLKEEDTAGVYGRLEIELNGVSEEDWANNWKQFYKTVRVGKSLVIVPLWEEYTPGENDVEVIMNPGMAFGTGTHETTRLCLEFVERFAGNGTRMLDIGTGSGILAISALRLGASSAVGVDIDEVAVKVAMENAELNGVEDRFRTVCGDLAEKVTGKFDLVTANIVADVIIRLAPDIPRFLDDGGIFVASGIIDIRADEVKAAIEACGLRVFETKSERGWYAFAAGLK